MQYTKAQDLAIRTHDHNLILVAGAGSGKTRVLVERYLGLLEANESWPLSALVAVTFTTKAAEEMRDRVRLSLEERLNDPVRATEVDRWSSLLSQVDSARISTIHGLCTSILRANAAHIGIDPTFTVLDEVDAAILLESTIDSVIAQLVAEDAPELELFTHYGQMRVRDVLTNSAIVNAAFPANEVDWLELWNRRWNETFTSALDRFPLHAAIGELERLETPRGDRLSEICELTLSAIELISKSTDLDACYQALDEICEIKLGVGSAKSWGSVDQIKEVRALLNQLRDEARSIFESIGERPGESDARAAELLSLWHSLLQKVQEAFFEAKQRQPALDFDDLERLTCNLLKNEPAVRSRYQGAEFRHLLVDEFQDTNARQWEIVQSLAVLDQPGTLFVVGDQKQSIYAFRGADVSVFGDVRAQIVNAGGREIQMTRSFRTHAPLVDAFNAIFECLLVRDVNSPVAAYQVVMDEPMTAERQQTPHGEPIISLILIDKAEHKVDDLNDQEKERLTAEERRRWEAQAIADHIQRMVRDAVHIHEYVDGTDTSRPVHYGDFAILFQSLTQVSIYEGALADAGIPYVTIAGRGYYNRQEVWDLLNLLRAVHIPSDDLSLAAALRSPLFGLSDDALFALRLQTAEPTPDGHAKPKRLWDALSDPGEYFPDEELEHLRFAVGVLHTLHAFAGRVTIYELLLDALSLTGYLATLSGLPQGSRMRGNVEKLLAKAQERGNVTLAAFTEYLGDMSDREVREGEAAAAEGDAVQLMTVHKSKGLEFPVVIIADASWESKGRSSDILLFDDHEGWACQIINPDTMQPEKPFMYRLLSKYGAQRDAAERLRLLYVAATRTRDYLIVSGQAEPKDGGWQSKGWLEEFINILDIRDCPSNSESFISYQWGQVRVNIPERQHITDTHHSNQHQHQHHITGWDQEWPNAEPIMPSLIHEINLDTQPKVHHLTASHMIAPDEIRRAKTPKEQQNSIRQLHGHVLHNTPEPVTEFASRHRKPFPRIIGEVVHEALRFGQFPSIIDSYQLIEILKNYAWRKQLTDPAMCDFAAEQAYYLLQQFETSPVYSWMTSATEIHHEIPFILEIESVVIHGIIDALICDRDGQWSVIDFKTGFAPANIGELAKHARPYHLQVGVYALAAATQLDGMTPHVYIHFIQQPQHPIRIPESAWRTALKRTFHQQIHKILEDDYRD